MASYDSCQKDTEVEKATPCTEMQRRPPKGRGTKITPMYPPTDFLPPGGCPSAPMHEGSRIKNLTGAIFFW